jgi:meso-butanediol dehydrogenase / (S,S)-butanediol dehydrogenase / diacetyl reductase
MAAAASPGPAGSVDLGLQGATIVVTGAGSGIGAAAAQLLGAAGAAVVLVERREALLRQCAGAIEQAAGRAVGVPADPATPARVISAALRAFGRVDGLVNDAAACRHFPLREWDVAGFDEHVATNVRAPYFLIQAALPSLRESPVRSVVNISSVSSFMTGAVIPLDGGQVIPHA